MDLRGIKKQGSGKDYIRRSLIIVLLAKCYSVTKLRRIRQVRHVACMGKKRCVNRVLVRKPERKRPLGRSRQRWKKNIKNESGACGCGLDRAGSG
jgi:hypothetical protein